jgi:hypothetical protein
MRFAIRYSAMNASEPVLNKLDELLSRVEDEIHELEITDADLLEGSAWYLSCRPIRRAMLEKTAQTTLYRTPRTSGPHMRRVEVADQPTADSAQALAYTPLHLIVENFSSDGALIRFALDLFATPEVRELCLGSGARRTPPAFRIESPGGHGEMPKLLNKRIDEAAVRGIRPRVLVVTDSDGEWVGDVKPHAQELRNKCAAAGVPCPPLNKRTAENYIPDNVWRAWAAEPQHAKTKTAIEALLRLSAVQRDHVNIGPGNTDPWDSSKPQACALFTGVSLADRALLKSATLKGRRSTAISYILDNYRFASNRADLLTRDNHGDLETVAQHIKDEL